jgi:6-phosphogluconolactonase (cycloisomerase 2 family)
MRSLVPKWGGLALLAAAAVFLSAGPAAASSSPVVGHVYVNDNTSGTNTIAAFDRHANGKLTPLPGSPFDAGGAGSGSGLASQGAIQVTAGGRYVLAVDAGSNEISVLRINPDGGLTLLHVVSSGGIEPVSVAQHQGLVYVANAGAGGSNYTGFTLHRSGQLHPLAGSTFALPDGSDPGDVLFNGTGTHIVGTRIGTSLIDSFRVGSGGKLKPAPGSPFPAQGLGPFGSEFRPTNPSQLFVSNAHNSGTGTVSAFRVNSDGVLFSIGASPFPDNQTAPCWVEITHNGKFLFTVNTGSGSVSRYLIPTSGRLILLGSTPLSTSNAGAVDARLSPDGRNLYVDQSKADSVAELAVSRGALTEVGVVPLPAGAAPAGMATN